MSLAEALEHCALGLIRETFNVDHTNWDLLPDGRRTFWRMPVDANEWLTYPFDDYIACPEDMPAVDRRTYLLNMLNERTGLSTDIAQNVRDIQNATQNQYGCVGRLLITRNKLLSDIFGYSAKPVELYKQVLKQSYPRLVVLEVTEQPLWHDYYGLMMYAQRLSTAQARAAGLLDSYEEIEPEDPESNPEYLRIKTAVNNLCSQVVVPVLHVNKNANFAIVANTKWRRRDLPLIPSSQLECLVGEARTHTLRLTPRNHNATGWCFDSVVQPKKSKTSTYKRKETYKTFTPSFAKDQLAQYVSKLYHDAYSPLPYQRYDPWYYSRMRIDDLLNALDSVLTLHSRVYGVAAYRRSDSYQFLIKTFCKELRDTLKYWQSHSPLFLMWVERELKTSAAKRVLADKFKSGLPEMRGHTVDSLRLNTRKAAKYRSAKLAEFELTPAQRLKQQKYKKAFSKRWRNYTRLLTKLTQNKANEQIAAAKRNRFHISETITARVEPAAYERIMAGVRRPAPADRVLAAILKQVEIIHRLQKYSPEVLAAIDVAVDNCAEYIFDICGACVCTK